MSSGNSATKIVGQEAADGTKSLALSHVNTDAPLLPVAELAALHNFRPDLVDKVIELTEVEGKHRRALALLTDERNYYTARRMQWISLVITAMFLGMCLTMAMKEAYGFALSMMAIGGGCVSALTAISNAGKGDQGKGSSAAKTK